MINNKNGVIYISIDFFLHLYLVLNVIFIGAGNYLTQGSLESLGFQTGSNLGSVVGKIIMFMFSLFLLKKKKIRIRKLFIKNIVILIIIWSILQYLKYHTFSAYGIMRLMNLYFAGTIIMLYRNNLFILLERILAKLALISLVLWIFTILFPDLMILLLNLSPLPGSGLIITNSWFVYGITDSFEFVRRNAGFAWEPGLFGSIMSFGMFLNLIINKCKIKGNKHFFFFFLSILSSQSTTAYMVMIFLFFFYFVNSKYNKAIFLFPVLVLLVSFIFFTGFLGDKISSLWIGSVDHQIDWEKQIAYFATKDDYIVPQRFDGLFYEFLNILHDPLIGNATDLYSYLYSMFGVKFSLSNGCLRIFANMGIVIGILYYILLYRASKLIAVLYKYKFHMAFFVFFIMINMSYSFIFQPIFLAILLSPLYKLQYKKVLRRR